MRTNHCTPTERTLPPLLAQIARIAELCHDCGRLGQIYADDHTTLLCAKCWLVRHEGTHDDHR